MLQDFNASEAPYCHDAKQALTRLPMPPFASNASLLVSPLLPGPPTTALGALIRSQSSPKDPVLGLLSPLSVPPGVRLEFTYTLQYPSQPSLLPSARDFRNAP